MVLRFSIKAWAESQSFASLPAPFLASRDSRSVVDWVALPRRTPWKLTLGLPGSSGGKRSLGCSPLGRKLLSDAQASISVPSTVKCSSLVSFNSRLRHHGAEKLARHVVLQQARPIAAKGRMVEAGLVPVHIQEPAEQKVVVQLLTKHPLAAHRIQRHQQRGFQQPLRRDRGPAHFAVHLLEQRRELFEGDFSQRLDQSYRMVGRDPLLGVHQRQHRRLWPIMSPHLPLPPQSHWPISTIPMQIHRSITSQRNFSTAC